MRNQNVRPSHELPTKVAGKFVYAPDIAKRLEQGEFSGFGVSPYVLVPPEDNRRVSAILHGMLDYLCDVYAPEDSGTDDETVGKMQLLPGQIGFADTQGEPVYRRKATYFCMKGASHEAVTAEHQLLIERLNAELEDIESPYRLPNIPDTVAGS